LIAPVNSAAWFVGTTVTVAPPDAELSAWETALTVTVVATLPPLPFERVGTPPGATYKPLLETNPSCWLPPATPFTFQLTAVFEEPVTFAVNCCVSKSPTLALSGETLTATFEPAVTVTTADPDALCEALAWDAAMIVTCAGEGTVVGALYKPVGEMLPLVAPPATLHVTAVFVVPETVAVNCCVLFTDTSALVGAIVTVIAGAFVDAPQPITPAAIHVKAQTVRAYRMGISGEKTSFIEKRHRAAKQLARLPWHWTTMAAKRAALTPRVGVQEKHRGVAALEGSTNYSMSRQLGPTQTSTTRGTVSL
jgi:hypothetical protein